MTSAVRIDLIGAGFIGRPHALTIHAVNRVSPACPLHAQAHMVAETDVGCVGAACNLGFESSTNRWDAVDRSDAVNRTRLRRLDRRRGGAESCLGPSTHIRHQRLSIAVTTAQDAGFEVEP